MRQLVDILTSKGMVTPEQWDQAQAEQQRTGQSVSRNLVDLGFISERQLVQVVAEQIDLEFVDLTEVAVDSFAVADVPSAIARRHTVLPVAIRDDRLVLAMADPGDIFAIDDVRSVSGRDVIPVVAVRSDVVGAIDRFYRSESDLDDLTGVLVEDEPEEDDLGDLGSAVADAPVVKFVNELIRRAISYRASDIHLEPTERDLRVRFRIDGVLHEIMRSPRSKQAGIISRLKIMSDIDISERRVPQDGRMSTVFSGSKVDLRVATLPTVWGEKVVMRILDNSTAMLDLADLGFSEGNYRRFSASFTKPYGMILVVGPTGSGKSTTLYATLNIINRPEVNIITVEDPVEYRLPGVNQVQTNTKAGLTFAAALRSILRSDPDIVLIGEIRDHETAQIAIESALTGHLVLSTLHTNDAPSAITRLVEMRIEPFLVGSAIDCVLAQRLARRLCSKCKEPFQPTAEMLRAAAFPFDQSAPLPTLYRPKGCSVCSGTGYKGRLALHEVMIVTEEIERLAVERATSFEVAEVARQQGLVTLRQDGMAKVAGGITSLDEVLRVVV